MPSLYNCRHDGDQYRISKFNEDWNVEASYLCDLTACECPAGHRPKCRHREMLPKFIQREHVGDEWFYDHDRGGWVQGASVEIEQAIEQGQDEDHEDAIHDLLEPSEALLSQPEIEPSTFDEDEMELIEPSAIMGDDSPHMGGINARVVAPAGLGQASDARHMTTHEILSYPQYNNVPIVEVETLPPTPSPSLPLPTPTIRRRV